MAIVTDIKLLAVNPDAHIQVLQLADSAHLIWVVDDFVADFDTLVDYSNNQAYFNQPGRDGTLFPGMRDEMPDSYYATLSAMIERLALQPQGQCFKRHQIAKCWLSKVTLTPQQLTPRQKMPHFDSLVEHSMAAVHYLNDDNLGGTNFYRYKHTDKLAFGFDDKEMILDMVEKVERSAEHRSGYINDSDDLFEKVFSIAAKPNRLVIYSGNILHSANITAQVEFDKSALNNRTSINSFFSVR